MDGSEAGQVRVRLVLISVPVNKCCMEKRDTCFSVIM